MELETMSNESVTARRVTTAVAALWLEWLAFWFDGEAHTVGGETTPVLPLCDTAFGAGSIRQPQAGRPEIRLMLYPANLSAGWVEPSERLTEAGFRLEFWVRARAAGTGQSTRLANRVAEGLAGLLRHPDARLALARKGIGSVRCQAPVILPDVNWSTRLVGGGCTAYYRVRQVVAAVPSGGSGQIVAQDGSFIVSQDGGFIGF